MPSPDDYDYSQVAENCRLKAEYAVHAGGAGTGDIINSNGMLRTMEQVLVDLITDEPAGLLLVQRRMDIQAGDHCAAPWRRPRAALTSCGWARTWARRSAPLISLDLFRRNIRPRHQKFIDLAKSLQSPGHDPHLRLQQLGLRDFIEMGIDAVDTLQPEAKNMAPAYLKKTLRRPAGVSRLHQHGGSGSFGTVAQVDAYCRRTLEIMMPGGGYCFAPTHQLQDNSPTENVLAMYEAPRKYGRFA